MGFEPGRLALESCSPCVEETSLCKGPVPLQATNSRSTHPLAGQAPSYYHIKSFPVLTIPLLKENFGQGNVLHLVLSVRHLS